MLGLITDLASSVQSRYKRPCTSQVESAGPGLTLVHKYKKTRGEETGKQTETEAFPPPRSCASSLTSVLVDSRNDIAAELTGSIISQNRESMTTTKSRRQRAFEHQHLQPRSMVSLHRYRPSVRVREEDIPCGGLRAGKNEIFSSKFESRESRAATTIRIQFLYGKPRGKRRRRLTVNDGLTPKIETRERVRGKERFDDRSGLLARSI